MKEHEQGVVAREQSLLKFFEDFYPGLGLTAGFYTVPADIKDFRVNWEPLGYTAEMDGSHIVKVQRFDVGRFLFENDEYAEKFCLEYRGGIGLNGKRKCALSDEEMDVLVSRAKEYISESCAHSSKTYESSTVCRILKALEFVGISLDEVSVSSLVKAREELKSYRYEQTMSPFSNVANGFMCRLNEKRVAYHENDPVPVSHHELSHVLYRLQAAAESIVSRDKSPASVEELNKELKAVRDELDNLREQDFCTVQMRFAADFIEFIREYMSVIEKCANGKYDTLLDWQSSGEFLQSLGLSESLDVLEFLYAVDRWLEILLEAQTAWAEYMDKADGKEESRDYYALYETLIESVNVRLRMGNEGKKHEFVRKSPKN